MTKVYLGSNLYEIHIGHQKITLSGDEVQEFTEELEQKVEKLEEKLKHLELELFFAKEKLEEKDVEILRLMEDVVELHER